MGWDGTRVIDESLKWTRNYKWKTIVKTNSRISFTIYVYSAPNEWRNRDEAMDYFEVLFGISDSHIFKNTKTHFVALITLYIYIYIMWKVKHSSFEAEKIEKSKIWPPVLRPNEQQIVVMYYKNDVVPSTEHFVYILLGHTRAVWWLKTQDKSQTGENVDKWLIVAELTTSDPPNTSTSRYCYYYYLDSWVLILLTALLTIIIVNQFSRWRNPIEG